MTKAFPGLTRGNGVGCDLPAKLIKPRPRPSVSTLYVPVAVEAVVITPALFISRVSEKVPSPPNEFSPTATVPLFDTPDPADVRLKTDVPFSDPAEYGPPDCRSAVPLISLLSLQKPVQVSNSIKNNSSAEIT